MKYVTVTAIDERDEVLYRHAFALDTVPEAEKDPKGYLRTVTWAIRRDATSNGIQLDHLDIEIHEVESPEEYYAAFPCSYNPHDREFYPNMSAVRVTKEEKG